MQCQLFSRLSLNSIHVAGTFLLLVLTAPELKAEEGPQAEGLKLFEERIMPIFKSEKPSSCVQCHLSSVDLKNYILPSHTATFLALRRDGLIDVDAPEKSKILTLIRMGDKDRDRAAQLIHEKTRKAEYEAFSSWIAACCRDPELRNTSVTDKIESVGPQKPLEIVRHARKSRVAESFARNIWSQRMRCFPCHTPHELNHDDPKHTVLIKRHQDFVRKFGAKMNIFQKTPEETMSRLIMSSRIRTPDRYPLINLEEPAKSLLLLKPTTKIPPKKDDGTFEKPSSFDPVSHMGGLKMHVNDQSYKAFMVWLQDYAAVAGDRYVSVDELPADNWLPTKRVIKLQEIPESWGEHSVVQLFVHAQGTGDRKWSAKPIAFTQGTITPRRMMMGPLSLFRSEFDSLDAAESGLKPGAYLIKAYVDQDNRLAEDPTALLDAEDFVGQAEIKARWRVTFRNAEALAASDLKK